jgi:hypothetical protein
MSSQIRNGSGSLKCAITLARSVMACTVKMDVGLSALSGTGAALFVLFVCRKYSYAIESIASRDGNRSISRTGCGIAVTYSGISCGTSTLPEITALDSAPNARRSSVAVLAAQLRAWASAPPE